MGEARQPPLSSPWPWTSKLSFEKFFQMDHFVWQLMGAMSNVINSTQWSSPQLATEEWRQVCYLSLYLVCGLHPQVSSVCGLCQLLPGIFVLVALVRTSPKQTKVSSQEHLRSILKGMQNCAHRTVFTRRGGGVAAGHTGHDQRCNQLFQV